MEPLHICQKPVLTGAGGEMYIYSGDDHPSGGKLLLDKLARFRASREPPPSVFQEDLDET